MIKSGIVNVLAIKYTRSNYSNSPTGMTVFAIIRKPEIATGPVGNIVTVECSPRDQMALAITNRVNTCQ